MNEHEVMDFAIRVADITNDLAQIDHLRFTLNQFRTEAIEEYLVAIEETVDCIYETLENQLRDEWKAPRE